MAKRNRKLREFKDLKLALTGQRIFFVSILLAIGLGVMIPENNTISSILIILGLAIGAINITAKEINSFLLASVTLMLGVHFLYILPLIGEPIKGVLDYLIYLVAPAAVLVALGMFYKLASTK